MGKPCPEDASTPRLASPPRPFRHDTLHTSSAGSWRYHVHLRQDRAARRTVHDIVQAGQGMVGTCTAWHARKVQVFAWCACVRMRMRMCHCVCACVVRVWAFCPSAQAAAPPFQAGPCGPSSPAAAVGRQCQPGDEAAGLGRPVPPQPQAHLWRSSGARAATTREMAWRDPVARSLLPPSRLGPPLCPGTRHARTYVHAPGHLAIARLQHNALDVVLRQGRSGDGRRACPREFTQWMCMRHDESLSGPGGCHALAPGRPRPCRRCRSSAHATLGTHARARSS